MNLLVITHLLDIVIGPTSPYVPTTIEETVSNVISQPSTPSIKALLFALFAALSAFFSWIAVTVFKKN